MYINVFADYFNSRQSKDEIIASLLTKIDIKVKTPEIQY